MDASFCRNVSVSGMYQPPPYSLHLPDHFAQICASSLPDRFRLATPTNRIDCYLLYASVSVQLVCVLNVLQLYNVGCVVRCFAFCYAVRNVTYHNRNKPGRYPVTCDCRRNIQSSECRVVLGINQEHSEIERLFKCSFTS